MAKPEKVTKIVKVYSFFFIYLFIYLFIFLSKGKTAKIETYFMAKTTSNFFYRHLILNFGGPKFGSDSTRLRLVVPLEPLVTSFYSPLEFRP